MADFDATIAEAGGQALLIPHRRRRDLLLAWRYMYAATLYAAKGRWIWMGYDWHVFSYHHTPAHARQLALLAYSRLSPPARTIVCPHDERLPAFEIVGGKLPDFRQHGLDIYVWPEGLDWTMAFTHEDGWFGPYFCRREWLAIE